MVKCTAPARSREVCGSQWGAGHTDRPAHWATCGSKQAGQTVTRLPACRGKMGLRILKRPFQLWHQLKGDRAWEGHSRAMALHGCWTLGAGPSCSPTFWSGSRSCLGGGHGNRPLTLRRLGGVIGTVWHPYAWPPRRPGEVHTPVYLALMAQNHNARGIPNARDTCREMPWLHDLGPIQRSTL